MIVKKFISDFEKLMPGFLIIDMEFNNDDKTFIKIEFKIIKIEFKILNITMKVLYNSDIKIFVNDVKNMFNNKIKNKIKYHEGMAYSLEKLLIDL